MRELLCISRGSRNSKVHFNPKSLSNFAKRRVNPFDSLTRLIATVTFDFSPAFANRRPTFVFRGPFR